MSASVVSEHGLFWFHLPFPWILGGETPARTNSRRTGRTLSSVANSYKLSLSVTSLLGPFHVFIFMTETSHTQCCAQARLLLLLCYIHSYSEEEEEKERQVCNWRGGGVASRDLRSRWMEVPGQKIRIQKSFLTCQPQTARFSATVSEPARSGYVWSARAAGFFFPPTRPPEAEPMVYTCCRNQRPFNFLPLGVCWPKRNRTCMVMTTERELWSNMVTVKETRDRTPPHFGKISHVRRLSQWPV